MLYRGGKRKNSILDIHDQTAECDPFDLVTKPMSRPGSGLNVKVWPGKTAISLTTVSIYILAEVLPDPGPQITGAVHKLTD